MKNKETASKCRCCFFLYIYFFQFSFKEKKLLKNATNLDIFLSYFQTSVHWKTASMTSNL